VHIALCQPLTAPVMSFGSLLHVRALRSLLVEFHVGAHPDPPMTQADTRAAVVDAWLKEGVTRAVLRGPAGEPLLRKPARASRRLPGF
jgi:hypothetical protein